MSVNTIKLSVKHGASEFDVSVAEDASVLELMAAVEAATGVMCRKQKLIFKGKVLEPSGGSLASYKLAGGSKVMLLASASESAPTKVPAGGKGERRC